MNKRYCLTLNLKNEPELIRQYEEHHKEVWPEIIDSIRNSGIQQMEIYRLGTRLFMIVEVNEAFSFERKNEMDKNDNKVQQWEELMWRYQQPLEEAVKGEKWMLLNKIFDLNEYTI
ncbi:MAG TPA: L-rhamnose mutarotase [Flavisolibacter sp.]|nr:L-rhamnose mutarotase [Flavisolibacter sp.]